MTDLITINVPDIGDFDAVEVIEVLVQPGDEVAIEDSLITLESDKASMEIPATHAGVVKEVLVGVGDKVAEGAAVVTVEASAGEAEKPEPEQAASAPEPAPQSTASAPSIAAQEADEVVKTQVVVIGSGPGGYTAAFRAADLGLDTVLVERQETLGGVCLNVGCIPSKALLHAAKVIDEAEEMDDHGVSFGKPKIDIDKLRGFKDNVIGRLTGGLSGLAKQRKVKTVLGTARFTNPNEIVAETRDGKTTVVQFDYAIVAAGSRPVQIPGFPHDDPRVMDSTWALMLEEVPKRMLIVGGGIIGLEMGTVYRALGSQITVVELMDGLVAGADKDIVKPFHKRVEKQFENIYLGTKVTAMEAQKKGIKVSFEGPKAPETDTFDRVLVAVGRRPNADLLLAPSNAGVEVDERGFIPVDKQMRTNVPHIFAIGDIVGQPMLAHKAVHEGKVAAEVIAGQKSFFDARVIPSVAYTDPEIAWVGYTEEQAKAEGLNYEAAKFPWAASGRSLSLGRDEGMTKLLFDKDTERVIGGGIVGPNAGDLIAEVALAIEMGCDAHDIGLTVHPHPTLSETVAMSAEAFAGSLTDLYMPKKK